MRNANTDNNEIVIKLLDLKYITKQYVKLVL